MPKFVSGSSGHIYGPDKQAKSEYGEQEDEQLLIETKAKQNEAKKPSAINIKGAKEKQKNSLDLFKEELRRLAEEREAQRKKVKLSVGDDEKPSENEPSISSKNQKIQVPIPVPLKPDPRCPTALTLKVNLNPKDKDPLSNGSFDTGDPTTTNLYVGNVNPTINENDLCDIFGKFGPLASIKIMWPRTDEERARNRNSGFVAYMSRVDAERAIKALNGLEIRNYEMKLGWGKAVPLPQNPVYIPPDLVKLLEPPPPSGLPFNAQLHEDDIKRGYSVPEPWPHPPPAPAGLADSSEETYQGMKVRYDEFVEVISRSTIRVFIPQDRETLDRIHRTIEHVIREGPVFESIIIARETKNPNFKFLYDNQSYEHVYYRWKLYSLLHGDDPYAWPTEKFKMFEGGPFWLPPPLNPFADGMPLELIEKLTGVKKDILVAASDDNSIIHSKMRPLLNDAKLELNLNDSRIKGSLGRAKSEALNKLLEDLNPSRTKIGSAMIFCIDHADAAREIVDLILNSLLVVGTGTQKKISRLYLISDILHNCSASVTNASYYRKGFHEKLGCLFDHLNEYISGLNDHQEAQRFKQKVLNVLSAWREWTLYEDDLIIKLSSTLLGTHSAQPVDQRQNTSVSNHMTSSKDDINHELDLDGEPLDEGTLVDCLEAKGLSLRWYNALELSDYEDDNDDCRQSDTSQKSSKGNAQVVNNKADCSAATEPVKFKTSKWEIVDPTEVAEQVVTISKWKTKST